MKTAFTIRNVAFPLFAVIGLLEVSCGKNDSPEDHTGPAHSGAEAVPAEADASASNPVQNGFDGMPPVGTRAVCPVMKNEFVVNDKTEFSIKDGKHYVFCCSGCKPQFDQNPDAFISPR